MGSTYQRHIVYFTFLSFVGFVEMMEGRPEQVLCSRVWRWRGCRGGARDDKGVARYRGGQRQCHKMLGCRRRREESARRCITTKEGKDNWRCDDGKPEGQRSSGRWRVGGAATIADVTKMIGNNEEQKEITARRHKILKWKTLSNKER
jgi:hypothetical protein